MMAILIGVIIGALAALPLALLVSWRGRRDHA